MAVYSVDTALQAILNLNTVDTVNIGDRGARPIRIVNMGSTPLYVTFAGPGQTATDPVAGGNDSSVVLANSEREFALGHVAQVKVIATLGLTYRIEALGLP